MIEGSSNCSPGILHHNPPTPRHRHTVRGCQDDQLPFLKPPFLSGQEIVRWLIVQVSKSFYCLQIIDYLGSFWTMIIRSKFVHGKIGISLTFMPTLVRVLQPMLAIGDSSLSKIHYPNYGSTSLFTITNACKRLKMWRNMTDGF